METEHMPLDLRLAAIITLLSSTALNGMTPGKADALCAHLQAAHASAGIDPHLKAALERLMVSWQDMASQRAPACLNFHLMTRSGHSLH